MNGAHASLDVKALQKRCSDLETRFTAMVTAHDRLEERHSETTEALNGALRLLVKWGDAGRVV